LASLIADSAAGSAVDAAAADCALLLQCLLLKSYPSRAIRFKYCKSCKYYKFQAFCVGDVGVGDNLMFCGGSGGGIGCVRNDAVDVVVAVVNRSVLSHLQRFGNLTPSPIRTPSSILPRKRGRKQMHVL
jgi:hypothetical protein